MISFFFFKKYFHCNYISQTASHRCLVLGCRDLGISGLPHWAWGVAEFGVRSSLPQNRRAWCSLTDWSASVKTTLRMCTVACLDLS
uniref:Uncharacterized protein n=1 Tax=Anguilla anguilla TaxID=7936 RepID=A0A0E9X3E5_ANGAN